MKRAPLLSLTLPLLLLVSGPIGCHDNADVSVQGDATDDDGDGAAGDVAGQDTAGADTAGGDTRADTAGDVDPDVDPDADAIDPDGDSADGDTTPLAGQFGAPCVENNDCLSSWCVESANGPVCTKLCEVECPEGWACVGVAGQQDVTFLCMPKDDRLCEPCAIDGQCGTGYCLTFTDGRRCTASCQSEVDCPSGYRCEVVTSEAIADAESSQCVPVTDACDCTAGNEGVQQPCNVVNDAGTCWGMRTCLGEEGWSTCDAPTPAAESCDGVDNNCNLLVDENLVDETPCAIENASGSCAGRRLCSGFDGWTCAAPTPGPDVCDYDDNNCDGQVDEGYLDQELGLYIGDTDCGVCGNSCVGFFPNALSGCAVAGGVARCVVTQCLSGFYQAGPTTCLPVVDAACLPCTADANCVVPGNACVAFDGGSFCGQDCAAGNLNGFDAGVCPAGFACLPIEDGRLQCLPETASCSCLDAEDGGKTRPCTRGNAAGTCAGQQLCDPADGGWTACSAREPAAETCNGADDDCNGVVDEGVAAPTEPCAVANEFGTCSGDWLCSGAGGWQCNAATPVAESCNYRDDNCDGATDEPFIDGPSGQYVTDDSCGLCGRQCDTVILFSSDTSCVVEDGLAACVANACAEGFYIPPDTNRVCIPTSGAAACSPCSDDAQCAELPGGACTAIDGGHFCTRACGGPGDCDASYSCVSGRCLPSSLSCSCRPEDAGDVRPCANRNGWGTCTGTSACDPLAAPGWSACSAATPTSEACNGQDDNCNGQIDEQVSHEPLGCTASNNAGTCAASYRCEGVAGWQCPVQTPEAEACNFQDDDCDGQVDEAFRDASGRYVDDEHCGTCGASCVGVIPNATAHCTTSGGPPRCEVASCETGYYQVGPLTCLPAVDTTCVPCVTDANCPTPGDRCLALDGGHYCGRDCSEGNVHGTAPGACAPGYACEDLGAGVRQCLPQSGSCSCLAGDADDVRTCNRQNGFGRCFGTELCVPASGWGGCTALTPAAESCNGVDDDCDGQVDEGLVHDPPTCSTTNVAGTCSAPYSCGGAAGWLCSAQTPAAETCDFKDNDCDGSTDEAFRNAAGIYVDDAHCGSCGISCAGAIPNATAGCVAQPNGAVRCEVAECNTGYFPASPLTCLPASDTTCLPCASDANCPTPGDRCLALDGGHFCGRDCTAGNAHGTPAGQCPAGFTCTAQSATVSQCLPVSGSCTCLAADAGDVRTCSRENAAGTCFGSAVCAPASGWGTCSARTPGTETCNGQDDDCDGQVDEAVPPPTEACAKTVAGVGTCTASWACAGASGWSCPAATPVAETCNFQDDDCDGQADESFRDAAGRYIADAHCGTCGVSCAGALPNATAACAATSTGGRCEVLTCDAGYYQASATVCLPSTTDTCTPCAADADCATPGDRCVTLGGGKFCGQDCSAQNAHGLAAGVCTDDGFVCTPIAGGRDQCVPQSGACDCLTGNEGDSRTCKRTNLEGSCYGLEACDPTSGWFGCTALTPTGEVCNGLDDNCNGLADEEVVEPEAACATTVPGVGTCEATWECRAAGGWVCPAATPASEGCNFRDDDCDGLTDEVFRDASGRYVSDAHCGTCGVSCAGAIPNATASCVTTSGSARCEVASCAAGYYKAGPLTCLAATDTLCTSCASDANCPTPGDRCLVLDGGTYCGRDCAAGNVYGTPAGVCPTGTVCADIDAGVRQCVPQSGSCTCRTGDSGKTRTCLRTSDLGTCYGSESCNPTTGWVGCTARVPAVEVCDAVDNNCNSAVDDVAGRGSACSVANTYGSCAGTRDCTSGQSGLVCIAQTPAPEICNYVDDDCDGTKDEGFTNLNTSCSEGTGACRRFGFYVCSANGATTACNAVAGQATTELCDNIDNDCDDLVDEHAAGLWDNKGQPCSPGLGVCRVSGVNVCSADGQSTVCSETAPTPAVTDEVGRCNGLDDDCDGAVDEDYPTKGGLCSVGQGVCKSFGNNVCAQDGDGVVCDAVAGQAGAEACDLLDNNCDGVTDDGFVNASGKYYRADACGNCFTNCEAIYDKPNAYGTCDSTNAPICRLTCCKIGSTDPACSGTVDDFDLNAVPDDGCEFALDTDAIYVSASDLHADDVAGCGRGPWGTGSGNFPCRSIHFGLAEAAQPTVARAKVLVADGLYEESITLVEGISLLGGYRADTWERFVDATNTTLRGVAVANEDAKTVIAQDITMVTTVVEGFVIYGPNTFAAGKNSYGLWVRDCTAALEIRGNLIFGGFGGDASDGPNGGNGDNGGGGQPGQASIATDLWLAGGCSGLSSTPGNQGTWGDAGTNTCSTAPTHGGTGAAAQCPSGTTKEPDGTVGTTVGAAIGGIKGVGGTDRTSDNCTLFNASGSATGLPGGDGGDGVNQAGGAGCSYLLGSVTDGEWRGERGANGTGGTTGAGGGGGGAGGGADVTRDCRSGSRRNDTLGGSGGGGGAGGCGGTGAGGGYWGGAAFALFVTNTNQASVANLPTISGNTITRGGGGEGGAGGIGGKGGLGGNGGDGGLATGDYTYAMGNGGRGGQGGDGGHGGGGGGGCGGPSFGIFLDNYSGTPTWHSQNAFAPGGFGGAGGQGGISPGSAGLSGSDGVADDWSW